MNFNTDTFSFGAPMPPMLDQFSSWGMSPTQAQASTPFGNVDFGIDNASGGGLFDGFLSKSVNGVTTQGWGGPALGVAQGLMSAFMGMKQYGMAKKQLAEGKRQFGLNYEAQRSTTNSALEDRQRARVASNAGAYQSVGDYMQKNAIKGSGG